MIGVSQSGEGVDINLTLENAKRGGAITLGDTNEANSSMTKVADETFLITRQTRAQPRGNSNTQATIDFSPVGRRI
ncbi:MAG: hypothetical protein U0Y68_16120 [Blastocatellia bacterium]